jgi:long-subunit acyl-CoA synthetase (AMP-forming)
VPIVHFYGAKEVDYILRATEPEAIVTADRFGHADHLGMYEDLLSRHPARLWLVAGATPARALPAAAMAFETTLEAEPIREPATVDPDAPALVAFTSGTTRDPKGVVHSHRTIGCETRQLNDLFPGGGTSEGARR